MILRMMAYLKYGGRLDMLTPLELTIPHWVAVRLWFASEEQKEELKKIWALCVKHDSTILKHKTKFDLTAEEMLPPGMEGELVWR